VSETKVDVAGRDMDAAVALAVMGWRDRMPLETFGEHVARPPTASGLHARIPAYSTDPGAAWQVVEAMRAKGWLVAVKAQAPGHAFIIPGTRSEYDDAEFARLVGAGKVVCDMQYMAEPFKYRDAFCMADTMPEAVCRAALSALNGGAR
jgi:hypothetical protein